MKSASPSHPALTTYDFWRKGNAADNANALALLGSVAGQYYYNTSTNQYVMDVNGNGLIQSADLAVTVTGTTAGWLPMWRSTSPTAVAVQIRLPLGVQTNSPR